MDHEQFLTMVAQIAHTDRDTAERASQIVLTVLGQHLTRGEAADVLRRLPEELQAYAWSPGSPERFPPEEFLRRVAEREGTDPLAAERHARAVFTALRQAIGPDEYADVRAQLGRHYAALLDAATFVPCVEAVVGAVAAEGGGDHDAARTLTEAVLETLAERIAAGDSDDLAARLPVALHPPLHRGRDADGLSRRMGTGRVRAPGRRAGRAVAGRGRTPHSRGVRRAAPDSRRRVLRPQRAAAGPVPPVAGRPPDRLTDVTPSSRALDRVVISVTVATTTGAPDHSPEGDLAHGERSPSLCTQFELVPRPRCGRR
jgi:uncharacterized protein (DUF2267 family)